MNPRKHISTCLIISGLAASALCVHEYIAERRERLVGAEYYVSIQESAMETPLGEIPEEFLTEAESETDAPGMVVPSMEQESEPEQPEWTPYVDFAAIRETAPGLVAWIRCEGTVIDYPVMQTDDNDYFLKHLPDGTENAAGSIFLDYRNAVDFSDKNSLIYGHHMKNGEMFASLKHYKEQEYYDTHSVLELHTENGDYTIELFAGYVVDAQTETVPRKFENDEAFLLHIDKIIARSTFRSEIEVTAADRLISLCTCIYDFDDARYILTGKLTETSIPITY